MRETATTGASRTMAASRMRPLLIASLAVLAAACARDGGGQGPLTGSISDARQTARAETYEDDEAPRAVPPDPYKGVRYRGGRDPLSGTAPGLDGTMPAPAAARSPARQPLAESRQALGLAPARPTAPDGAGQRQMIEVREGDTLYALAARNRVSVAALMQANNLTTPRIVPGQRLLLP